MQDLAARILPAVAEFLERELDIEIVPEALTAAARISADGSGRQPGKAIRLLARATARAQAHGIRLLGPDDVIHDET